MGVDSGGWGPGSLPSSFLFFSLFSFLGEVCVFFDGASHTVPFQGRGPPEPQFQMLNLVLNYFK